MSVIPAKKNESIRNTLLPASLFSVLKKPAKCAPICSTLSRPFITRNSHFWQLLPDGAVAANSTRSRTTLSLTGRSL